MASQLVHSPTLIMCVLMLAHIVYMSTQLFVCMLALLGCGARVLTHCNAWVRVGGCEGACSQAQWMRDCSVGQ